MAGLVLARVDAGVLDQDETAAVGAAVETVLGERLPKLRDIWRAAHGTPDDDGAGKRQPAHPDAGARRQRLVLSCLRRVLTRRGSGRREHREAEGGDFGDERPHGAPLRRHAILTLRSGTTYATINAAGKNSRLKRK